MKIEVQHYQRNADWLIVNTLTRSTSRSRRCLLQQEYCAGVHLLRSKRTTAHSPGPPAQKRKNHTDDRREQLRRGSEDRPCTHSPACRSIDVVDVSSRSIPRFQASFSRQLNSSEIYVRVRSSGARASCLETERKSTEVKKKASRDLGYRPCTWRRVAKKSVGQSK